MSASPVVTAEHVARVVQHLNAAGLYALAEPSVGPTVLAVEVLPDHVLAFVDLADAATQIVVMDRAGRLGNVANKPRGVRGVDPHVDAGALLGWVLEQRGVLYRTL